MGASEVRRGTSLGSQHPSSNVKTFCKFEPQIWLETITSRDARSACIKGSRTSCREINLGIFWTNFGQKRSHHVMDASCRFLHSFPSPGAPVVQSYRFPNLRMARLTASRLSDDGTPVRDNKLICFAPRSAIHVATKSLAFTQVSLSPGHE